jgi:predicted nicotinamide N-methyase
VTAPADFIRSNTALIAPPLVPEVRLHLATELVALWRSTEEELAAQGVPPPYWAFAWAGGQALARYILDRPQIVAGKSVLDFGSGSGLVAIAAMKAGARAARASDVDIFAAAAIALNARANDVEIEADTRDLIGSAFDGDTILVGDMCYERPLADRLLDWLHDQRERGRAVLLGDPGRSYFPKAGIEKLASYSVQTTRELEDREIRETGVYELVTPTARA